MWILKNVFKPRSPQCFNQAELNDLVKDLSLSKELSELLASRLNEKNLLQHGTKVTFYRSRGKDLLQYFRVDSDLVYCHVFKCKECGTA